MAVQNFIQTIWSKKIQDALELKCKLVDNCLHQYEGDVKHARTVKILGVGEIEKNLTVKVNYFSESAKTKIEAAGGKAEVI